MFVERLVVVEPMYDVVVERCVAYLRLRFVGLGCLQGSLFVLF